MGQKVLIIGGSGTGKSTSLRNFGQDEICLIKTVGKPLPFRSGFVETTKTDKVAEMIKVMKATDKKVIVIDDAQYVMGNEFFRRAAEQGWNKFTDIGKNFYDLLTAVEELPEDTIVYFLLHTEKDSDGNIKVKTIGKMLDEKLTIEGLATIVLMTNVVDGNYTFQTQNSGKDICKSPMGMFKNYLIENDLKMVDGIIREYWYFSDEIVEEKGVQAEKTTRGRRGANEVERKVEEAPVKRERKPLRAEEPVIEEQEPTSAEQAPVEEELPKRRERKAVDVAPPQVEIETREVEVETTPVRKSLAEKLAEGGYEQPVQRTRRRA